MKRAYIHINMFEAQTIKLREAGKTRQEIADALGLTKKQIKAWIWRNNKKKCIAEPKKRGHPRKTPLTK